MAEVFNGFDVIDKIHDESRQGEAFLMEEVSLPQEKQSRKFYIETYGCAMNFSDTEIIASVLNNAGFSSTDDFTGADLILLNTCSIRDNAEQKVRKRLTDFRVLKKANPGKLIGVLGCMAERLKSKFLDEEKIVDLVVGPDAYRDLPKLIASADDGEKGVNVLLSREETYADISPVRLNSNGVSAFISITRGCNNMCSFCVVPFTRGRERSRDAYSITNEAKHLFNQGYREVTLLGQNVDSYLWKNENGDEQVNFAHLLEMVALVNPMLRVRFSTSHPKDLTDEVLYTIIKHHNICNHIHLPVQSGSSSILERMNRTYDRDWYMERINRIKELIPDCGISTDMIIGFCGETEEDHLQTLGMMEYVKYNLAYVYKYSERPGTYAAKQFADDVPEEIKSRRLSEIVDLQRRIQQEENIKEVGKEFEVLAEGFSKRSDEFLSGRNPQSKMVIFPKMNYKKGDYVKVRIVSITSATLIGEVIN